MCSSDLVFGIAVSLGGSPVPAGTPYTVSGQRRTVETVGIVPLAHGETAVFTGLLAGTAYAVSETPQEGFRASYAASVTAEGQTVPAAAAGEVPVGGSVAVIVTNATYDYAIEIPLTSYFGSQLTLMPSRLYSLASSSEMMTEKWASQSRRAFSCSCTMAASGLVSPEIASAISTDRKSVGRERVC